MRSHRLPAVVIALLAVMLTACTGTATAPPISPATQQALQLDGDWGWQRQGTPLDLGVTHTQRSLDPGEPARAAGVDILRRSAIWQNNHLMGFGTLNPEPAPGEYDWSSLDRRMQLVEDTGGRTVLTLCCAPDWMKGGTAGETDWSRLEEAPLPEDFDAFADLSAQAVARYPQVERVLVWNELKGFYNDDENRWNYEGYTQLYNKIYQAVKAVRPDVQIGGPYAVMSSLDPGSEESSDVRGPWGVADQRALDIIDYWLANNVGADFLAVDGATATRQETEPRTTAIGAQKFADITTWIRGRTDLPIWWAEFYPDVPAGQTGGPSSPASAVATLAAVAAWARSGASGALLWGPQGSSLAFSALWTDSTESDGGRPTPLTAPWQWLMPRLAQGTVEIGYSPTAPLLAFRAADGTVVVNLTGDPVTLAADTDPLPAWSVTMLDNTT